MTGMTLGNDGDRCQEADRFYTVAVWIGKEKRPAIDAPMKQIMAQFDVLTTNGLIDNQGNHHDVTLKWCSDMKFTSLASGVTAACASGDLSETRDWCFATYGQHVSGLGEHAEMLIDEGFHPLFAFLRNLLFPCFNKPTRDLLFTFQLS